MKRKFKLAIFFIGITLMLQPGGTYAQEDEPRDEPGQLHINTHAITDTTEIGASQLRSIGYELVPDLFLEASQAQEAMRREALNLQLEAVQEQVFLNESPDMRLNTDEVVSLLFDEAEYRINFGGGSNVLTLPLNIHTWLWVIIGISLTVGGIALGVFIGKRIQHLIYRPKKERSPFA